MAPKKTHPRVAARFRRHVRQVFRDVIVPGQKLGQIEFDGRFALVRIEPDGTLPGRPFRIIVRLGRARNAYEVLRELTESGYTHNRYDRNYHDSWLRQMAS